MNVYCESHFWSFRLFTFAAAAVLSAQLVTHLMERSLAISAADITRARPWSSFPEPDPDPAASLASLLRRNVFKAHRQDLAPKALLSPVKTFNGDASTCEPSGLSANLVTTMVTDDPAASVAVFYDRGRAETLALRIGELIFGARVATIDRKTVLVINGERCERFSLDHSAEVAPPDRGSPPSPQRRLLLTGIQKLSDREYLIPRQTLERTLSRLDVVASQGRIIPAYVDGKSVGFKVSSIRPGSLYAQLGIQPGDVVRRINGYDINTPQRALRVYTKLKDASTVTIDLVRGSENRSITYSIR